MSMQLLECKYEINEIYRYWEWAAKTTHTNTKAKIIHGNQQQETLISSEYLGLTEAQFTKKKLPRENTLLCIFIQ